MMQALFHNTIFRNFLSEVEAIGFEVSVSPKPGAKPYAVIGGRSNARWWLVPLSNRRVATSGLALFQPILPSAKILKSIANIFNTVGLSSLWARNKVYISCPPVFADLFGNTSLSYAFFTGTESPHRKAAIQIMSTIGEIKGFAKISKQKEVQRLIEHECKSLEYANSLKLTSSHIPHILFNNEINGAAVLVTDTRKTRHSKSPVSFTKYHADFLSELANKSNNSEQLHNSNFLQKIKQQAEQLAERLPEEWNKRLALAIQKINNAAPTMKIEMVSCHGDFTPWNTFMVDDKLYVFDWEYAQQYYPPGYDLIHFHLSLPTTKRQPTAETLVQTRELLKKRNVAENDTEADILFLCYLCEHTLQYASRESRQCGVAKTWDGNTQRALYFNILLEASPSTRINSLASQ